MKVGTSSAVCLVCLTDATHTTRATHFADVTYPTHSIYATPLTRATL